MEGYRRRRLSEEEEFVEWERSLNNIGFPQIPQVKVEVKVAINLRPVS